MEEEKIKPVMRVKMDRRKCKHKWELAGLNMDSFVHAQQVDAILVCFKCDSFRETRLRFIDEDSIKEVKD